ncbi:type IV secretory system conjugative DNA transfer family protein [Aerococcaceae bacterium NML160702]|nr:type IV secretory system conjugative DNA transfer family protein [Aerococcaceae bacterium NML160702]
MRQMYKWAMPAFLSAYLFSNYLGNTYFSIFRGRTFEGMRLWLQPSGNYLWLYFFVGCLFALIFLQFERIYHRLFGELRQGYKATNRLSTDDDIRKSYKEVAYLPSYDSDGEVISYPGLSGSLISRIGDYAYLDTSDSHSLIVGRTRSGKDETKALPELELISRSEEKPHIIYSTVKYDTIEKTKRELELRGYHIAVLNLEDMDYSFGYNSIDLIKKAYMRQDIDEAVELCKNFTHPLYDEPNAKDPFWNNIAMSLVNACILAMCHEFLRPELEKKQPELVTMGSLVSMFTVLSGTYQKDKETRYFLDDYFAQLPDSNPAKQEYVAISFTTGQMRSSIFGTALSKLQKFVAPKVVKMMNRTTFDFEVLTQSEQPHAVFIILPDYTKTNYIIATTWIEQVYFYLSKFASQHNDRLPKRVRFILNEFGNMPAFNSLESMISVGAGRGMLFDFYVQDFKQFTIKYGKDIAMFVESQVMNLIYITSTNRETQEKFSKLLGNEEVVQKSRSGAAFSLSKNISEQVEKKPLLFPEQLANLLEGEWVVIRSKRKTETHEDVIPYPIYNHGSSRMLTAYNYLDDVFQRVHFSQLNLNQHHNAAWTDKEYAMFINTMRERLHSESPTDIKDLEEENNLHNEIKEAKAKMKQLVPYSRYDHTEDIIDGNTIQDQVFDNRLTDLPLYQEVSKKVNTYFTELKDIFNAVSSEDELKDFVTENNHILRIASNKLDWANG